MWRVDAYTDRPYFIFYADDILAAWRRSSGIPFPCPTSRLKLEKKPTDANLGRFSLQRATDYCINTARRQSRGALYDNPPNLHRILPTDGLGSATPGGGSLKYPGDW